MAATIKLDTNFAFGGSGFDGFSLPAGVTTIGDLLRHIGKEVDFPFIDPGSGELEIDLEISINGKERSLISSGRSLNPGRWCL